MRIAAILFCICIISCSENVQEGYKDIKLNGKVKNITETYFSPIVSGDTVKKGEQIVSEPTFFESRGEEVFLSQETKIFFNMKKQIMEFSITDSISELYFKELFEYKDNLLLTRRGLLSDEFFYKEVFHYDSKQREIERVFFDAENRIFETIVKEYPEKNKITELVYTPEDSEPIYVREIIFENGLPTTITTKYEGSIMEKWVGEYENGNVIRAKIYDDLNNLIQYTKCTYDNYGNELEFSMYTAMDELIDMYKFQYKYDNNGNWIQQVTIVNNEPEVIVVRDIKYY